MDFEEMKRIGRLYDATFGNLDEICAPEILANPAFVRLLSKALESGQAVTRAQIDIALPGVAWDY